jgi:V/A-type H+-transporting ATPase subunit E
MMKPHRHAETVSQGVEQLLAQLKEEGLEAGRKEAQALIDAGERRAREIIATAQSEADDVRKSARRDAQTARAAGEAALQAAVQDAILGLRQSILDRFSADLHRLVSSAMEDPALIRTMILEAASGVGRSAGLSAEDQITAVLPSEDDAEALRRDSQAIKATPATQVLLSIVGRVLEEGVELETGAGARRGVTLQLRGGDIEIDLSDSSVARLIAARLQPRFRALFDGVIR